MNTNELIAQSIGFETEEEFGGFPNDEFVENHPFDVAHSHISY